MPFERNHELEDIYKIHRDYIEHEDNLINQRVTWFITIQSFLIATFGLSYQKKYEVAAKLFEEKTKCGAAVDVLEENNISTQVLGTLANEYSIFLIILATVGFLMSIFAYFSIRSAALAITAIRNNWCDQIIKDHPIWYLPGITGGGDERATRKGMSLSDWAPPFFCVMWLGVIAFLLIATVDVSFR